jgi:arylsulfatase A-like enzyme
MDLLQGVGVLYRGTINYFISILIFFILTLSPAFATEKKNIILITFDAMGAKYLPFYGFNKNTAPHLNAFSKDCYLFVNAISQSGSTSISLGSLFTSLYPFADNLIVDKVNVKQNKLFLPYYLKGRGYHTYAIVRDEYAKSKYGFGHGFDYFDEDYVFNDAENTFTTAISLAKYRLKEPFFLWIHNEEPHSPYLPPEKYFREFYHHNTLPTVYSFIDRTIRKPWEVEEAKYDQFNKDLLKISKSSAIYRIYARTVELGEEELEQLKARYLGNIKYADEQFGRFMSYIKTQPFFKNTILIVSADHGESLGSHNVFDHNDLFQDMIHVPLLLHLPGQNFGQIIDKPLELVDIYPTIIELLGFHVEHNIRGENMLKEKRDKSYQFSEYPWKKVVIKNKIKYVCDQDLFYSYHLDVDPDEIKMITEHQVGAEICQITPLSGDIFFNTSKTANSFTMKNDDNSPYLASGKIMHLRSTELNKFKLVDFLDLKKEKTYVLARDNEHLKINVTKNVDSDLAHRMIDRELFQIKSVFTKSFSPYPEQLSNEIECPKELMPIYYQTEAEGEMHPYLLTYSNDRFGIGICSKDLVSFRHLIGWIYCSHEKELYRIKYFIPMSKNDEGVVAFFTTLTCQH